ncbi:iron ABC transporter permease [Cellulomonas iranensis]|uniref:iron ABC transporter permease n=1 Tax=Cellulomonas iranensis TaxID=76862 RepID=UPI001CF0D9B0|nr:iron ABC transporter permease [Cellulomonas iranensis]UCN15707.1 iron ABC transporter permease [Cellulomonas iranensis]
MSTLRQRDDAPPPAVAHPAAAAARPDAPGVPSPRTPRRGSLRVGVVLALVAAWVLAAVVLHLVQGTADVGLRDLLALVTGDAVDQAAAVVVESRVPRLLAAVLVGTALGASGTAMQAVARNPLASPDTTAVNAGAYLALTLASAFGTTLAPLAGVGVAFVGGIAAAALVIGLSSGRSVSVVRLVLAGSVVTMGLASITSVVMLLLPWEVQGMFAWGAGSLSQNGSATVVRVLPVVAAGVVALLLLARRLDVLQLGDDAARSLGMRVGATRVVVVVVAVLLAASAVSVTGPIGFVGLCAPLLVRLAARRVRQLTRHRVLILASAATGVALVLTADVLLRAVFGSVAGVTVPTGVVTSALGAVFLIVLARRLRSGDTGEALAGMRAGTALGRRAPWLVLTLAGAALLAALVAAVLLGDRALLLGDVDLWLRGAASVRLEIILDSRVPRVLAALLAGACLALAGALVQAVTRNPLADPGVLGVSSAAGLGAVVTIVAVPAAGFATLFGGALLGAAVAAVVLLGGTRGGDQVRTVLVGVGIGAFSSALTTLLLVRSDPWNQNKAMTWLAGSTYGATWVQQLPMVVVLVLAAAVLVRTSRDLDVLQLDDLTPRVLGVAVPRARLVHVALAIVLTAAATASIGVVAFVGLVAPHAARLLIGKRHALLLPLTVLLGATLVVVADLVGRATIAPAQLPAGLVTSLIGTPYFLWLLWRIRTDR